MTIWYRSFALMALLLGLLASSKQTYASSDTILTFNVLCSICPRDESVHQSWEDRRGPIFELINEENPDLMAIQEVYGPMLDDFETRFASDFSFYQGTLYDESLPVSPGHLNLILFRTSKYRFIRGGSFRLGQSPLRPARRARDAYRRTCTWAVLQKRSAGREQFRFLSCHLPFNSRRQSKIAVQTLANWLWTTSDRELPQIVAGDFNIRKSNRRMKYLLREAGRYRGYDYPSNWKQLVNETRRPRIDFILHEGLYQATESYKIGTRPYEGSFRYSDHPAIVLRGEITSITDVEAALPSIIGPLLLLLEE